MSNPERLSPVTAAALAYIADCIDATGVAPTVREIGATIGRSSTSVTRWHILRLQELGLVARGGADGRAPAARALYVTREGYALLGRPSPAEDAALGRALRQLARLSPRAADVLAMVEAVA